MVSPESLQYCCIVMLAKVSGSTRFCYYPACCKEYAASHNHIATSGVSEPNSARAVVIASGCD